MGPHGLVHTVIYGPQGFSNSERPVWESTNLRYSLVRLHGRNAETWNIKGAASATERFNHDYPKEELIDLPAHIERLSPETLTTHVIFNSNCEDEGQRNAASLIEAIAVRRKALVPHLVLPEEWADEVEAGEWVAEPA